MGKWGYAVKSFDRTTKRYCQTLDLKDDPALIEKYRRYHSQEYAWPEIRAGIREVGILEMEIFIHDNHLFMIVEVPEDFDWDKSMERLATLPRQQEWEEFVAPFQMCNPKDTSDGKWHLMERIFHLYE